MNVAISVIIPVYNGAEFVESAYRQIQGQQLLNAEIIFVDNNSTDGSLTLLDKLQENHQDIAVLKEKKQGAAAARNKGLTIAKGEFIYFFDVDDKLMPGALHHLINVLKTKPEADSVFGVASKNYTAQEQEGDFKISYKAAPFWGMHWFNNFSKLTGGPPAFLHRKRVFDKIGNFPEQLLLGEDAAFHIKLGLHCFLLHTEKVIFYYHRHDASTVSRNNKKQTRAATYWQQYVNFYIDYHINKYPNVQFGSILRQKMLLSMIRLLRNEKGIKNRIKKYKALKEEIKPLKIHKFIEGFFTILVFLPLPLYIKIVVKVVKKTYPETINPK